jgi:hypothetical protein
MKYSYIDFIAFYIIERIKLLYFYHSLTIIFNSDYLFLLFIVFVELNF